MNFRDILKKLKGAGAAAIGSLAARTDSLAGLLTLANATQPGVPATAGQLQEAQRLLRKSQANAARRVGATMPRMGTFTPGHRTFPKPPPGGLGGLGGLGALLRPKKPGPAPSGLPPAPTPTAAEKAEQKRLQETQQRRAREAEQAAREAAQGRGGGRPLTPEGLREAPPPRPAEPRPQQERRQPPRALPRQMERVEQETPLDQFTRDIIAGTMFEVRRSSNVHSIGFVIEAPGQTKGDLFIRFLGTSADGKKRQGPGPVYQYTGVPLDLFREFLVAASAGKFVWDYIRVRGTVSGHRFPYELVGIVGDYVPRQAALRRGQAGEWYLKRIFTDTRYNTKTGKLERVKLTSQLPEQRVSMRGPNPDRGPGIDALRFGR